MRGTSVRIRAFVAAAIGLFGCDASRRADFLTPCRAGADGPLPSADLYCMELTPIPALSDQGITATFELNRIPSPFGTNVTRYGNQVYAPVLRVAGLPDAQAFDSAATAWVAWIATPEMMAIRKLGVVGNGEHRLPNVDWPKFLILVTAEPSPDVEETSFRVALRGLSPSSRLQPPDMTEFLYGTPPVDSAAARQRDSGEHEGHGAPAGGTPASGAGSWIHPSMPRGLAMMPAEMQLAPPAVSPFLPQDGRAIPDVKPRELVQLSDGDTLTLTAGPVRQSVRGASFIGYGYNGQVPGPMLSAPQGATVHVRYRNQIGWGTTIHWHGIRLANAFDGAEGLTQDAVPDQGEFLYTVRLPDAGLYWYHPHRRDDVLRDLGLYGNVMVRSPTDEGSRADARKS